MIQEDISIFPEPRIVYGSFWQRLAAAFLDGIILVVPRMIVGTILGNRSAYADIILGQNISTAGLMSDSINFLIPLFYFALMESGKSQATVGKMALQLKVTDMNGNRISFAKALGRYLGKFVSFIIICIGYLMVLWDARRQALHDKMAGTLVVKK